MQHWFYIEVAFWRNAFGPSSERSYSWVVISTLFECMKLTRVLWTLTWRWVIFKTKDLADGEGQRLTGDFTRWQRTLSMTGRSFNGRFVQYADWYDSSSHCTHQEKLLHLFKWAPSRFDAFLSSTVIYIFAAVNHSTRRRSDKQIDANSPKTEERTIHKNWLARRLIFVIIIYYCASCMRHVAEMCWAVLLKWVT